MSFNNNKAINLEEIFDLDELRNDPELSLDVISNISAPGIIVDTAKYHEIKKSRKCAFPDCEERKRGGEFCALHDPNSDEGEEGAQQVVQVVAAVAAPPAAAIQVEGGGRKRKSLDIPDRCEHRGNKTRCKEQKWRPEAMYCMRHADMLPPARAAAAPVRDVEEETEDEKAFWRGMGDDRKPAAAPPAADDGGEDKKMSAEEKEKEEKKEEEDDQCAICFNTGKVKVRYCDNPSCNFQACMECNENTAKGRKCPWCRQPIKKLVEVKRRAKGGKVIETRTVTIYTVRDDVEGEEYVDALFEETVSERSDDDDDNSDSDVSVYDPEQPNL
jgi:hypothetical protein